MRLNACISPRYIECRVPALWVIVWGLTRGICEVTVSEFAGEVQDDSVQGPVYSEGMMEVHAAVTLHME